MVESPNGNLRQYLPFKIPYHEGSNGLLDILPHARLTINHRQAGFVQEAYAPVLEEPYGEDGEGKQQDEGQQIDAVLPVALLGFLLRGEILQPGGGGGGGVLLPGCRHHLHHHHHHEHRYHRSRRRRRLRVDRDRGTGRMLQSHAALYAMSMRVNTHPGSA